MTGTISSSSRPAAIAAVGALLAAQRERILIGAGDAELGGDVLGGLRHRVDRRIFAFISGLTKRQPIVVSSIFAARENALSALAITNGARVMLSTPPAIIERRLAALDCPRGDGDRVHARSAQPVHRRPRHGSGQPGQQQRHARDVAIVLARLIGAAVDDVVDRRPVDPRIALDERTDRNGRQVIGADSRERAAVAAERRADRVAEEGIGHCGAPFSRRAASSDRASGTPVSRCNSSKHRPSTISTHAQAVAA